MVTSNLSIFHKLKFFYQKKGRLTSAPWKVSDLSKNSKHKNETLAGKFVLILKVSSKVLMG